MQVNHKAIRSGKSNSSFISGMIKAVIYNLSWFMALFRTKKIAGTHTWLDNDNLWHHKK